MEDIGHDLEVLARELVHLATTIGDSAISRRLTEMADEMLALADRHVADSQVYHSATLFLHTGGSDIAGEPGADDPPTCPTQRH